MKRKFMVLCAVIFFLALGMQTDIQPAYAAENTTIAGEDATAVEQTYSVTVIFKSNKGKGSMSSQVVTSNTTIKLKANKFKRTGYTFTGWNTKSNGKGISYANKADASSLATPNNNGKTITLYAQWKIAPPAIKKATSPTPSHIKVTYGKNTAASGYVLQYSTSKKFTASKTKTRYVKKNTTSAKLLDVVPNKKYYVRMRSYRGSNPADGTKCSDWSKTLSVKVKNGKTIMNTKCYKAIEADVKLTGSGTGYHAKLVIGNNISAVSYGIQYDKYAVSPYAGKAVTLIENISTNNSGGQSYVRPSGKALKKNKTYHLMITVDKKGKGGVYLDYKKIGSFYQPGLANNPYWNYARLEASGRLNGDKVDATFSNICFKVSNDKEVRYLHNFMTYDEVTFGSNSHVNAGLKRKISKADGTVRMYGTMKGVNGDWDSDYDNVSQYAVFNWP